MPDLRYPKYDLDQSIEVARKISDRGAGAVVSGDELAVMLEYSGTNNGAYLNRIAAARMFGLVEGQGDTLRATELAQNILHPDYPDTEIQGRIDAFRSVPLYSAFLEAYRGRELPDSKGIHNTLVSRYGVPEAEAGKVAGRLLRSADEAGLFKVGGATRMVVPTPQPRSVSVAATETAQGADIAQVARIPDTAAARRFPKIIEGALDLMPAGPPWDADEYREWLTFFDQACRVYYRISRSRTEKPE